ncbi:MAG: hypothetical protein A3J38_02000 [Gammaproteobacteria bacterium RIFCSPHIGHO2_12_FULL_45_9]|nr:MAG: hypothetical protein A3J38_02000 [Gammaproteobacteria bacterium RIFCSPHIGHO2_12_FULL_45_9]
MRVDWDQETQENNKRYAKRYRHMLRHITVLTVFGVVLSAGLCAQWLMRPAPQYFASTIAGELVPMQPLSAPVVTHRYLLEWAETVARGAYNLDFVHYQTQLNTYSNYFTPGGWSAFQGALSSSGFLDSLQTNKLSISAIVSNAAVVLDQGLRSGRWTWTVQVPVLVTFTSASEVKKANYIVTLTIQRVPVLDLTRGIAVIDFSAEPA